ncbi:BACH1_ putativelike, partial [Caligus rogercresseyi]
SHSSRMLSLFPCHVYGELAESRQTEVTIRDVDENAMELLVDFCYTSFITVEESNVQTLLPAACLLQLQEIQDVCCEFLSGSWIPPTASEYEHSRTHMPVGISYMWQRNSLSISSQ